MRYMCKKTDQMGMSEILAYNFLQDYAITMYNTVGLESVAMFGSFGLFAVWCYIVENSHLALQRESKVLLLGFPMDFISYNLNK
jgi:hypothetical protein